MTDEDLSRIAAEAEPLWDRLRRPPPPDSTSFDPDRARVRVDSWKKVLGSDDDVLFERRIRMAGWDRARVERVLGTTAQWTDDSLPDWSDTLRAVSEFSKRGCPEKDRTSLRTDNPLPFEDLLFPAVLFASERLRESHSSGLISPDARVSLERALLHELSILSVTVLQFEFSKTQPDGRRLLSLLNGVRPGRSTDRYTTFVTTHLTDGLRTLFLEYPVYARLLAMSIDFWVESTSEFLARASADMGLLDESGIFQLTAGLSDFHHGHRTVLAVEFHSGRKLVYKPRSVATERVFSAWLLRLNQLGFQPEFKAPRIWDRESYGWAEFMAHRECGSDAEVRRYYQRAGGLLCLLYVMQAMDCHAENIVAAGEHPVLVDTEAILQPRSHSFDRALRADATADYEEFFDSVVVTGLLPHWENTPGDGVADFGGLALWGSEHTLKPVQRLKAINTDQMDYVYEHIARPGAYNVPVLDGQPAVASGYVDELVQGFESTYKLLLDHRDEFLSNSTADAALDRCRVRFVFRPTRVYDKLLNHTLAPAFLQDGVAHSLALDALRKPFLTPEKPLAWPILDSELSALEQGDIPYFSAGGNGEAFDGGVTPPIEDYFQQSGYSRFLGRLRHLSIGDLNAEKSIVRGMFAASVAVQQPVKKPLDVAVDSPGWSAGSPMPDSELLEEAERIAREISNRAIRTSQGRPNWTGVSPIPGTSRFHLRPIGDDLYEGRFGVALFLAAFDYATAQDRHSVLIENALSPVRNLRESATAMALTRRVGIGGVTGLMSMVYALVCIGKWMGRPEMAEDAVALARTITPDTIDGDVVFDIMSGSAGVILGLLALYRVVPKPEVLDMAIRAGHHLLKNRVSIQGTATAWKSISSRPLTGFSHGAAGIAYALLRLYETAGDPRFLEAAQAGIRYETSLFSADASNWPDLRDPSEKGGPERSGPEFCRSWCHGAAGIGLARIGGSRILHTMEIQSDIDAAVHAIAAHDLDDEDHLCCGNFGRLDFLAASVPAAGDDVRRRVRFIVERARRSGGYRIAGTSTPEAYSPAFFRGTAGIGYALLRLARPGFLPSVLLLDT